MLCLLLVMPQPDEAGDSSGRLAGWAANGSYYFSDQAFGTLGVSHLQAKTLWPLSLSFLICEIQELEKHPGLGM